MYGKTPYPIYAKVPKTPCGIFGTLFCLKQFAVWASAERKAGCCKRLLTQTESLDDGTIAVDVAVVQIVEQCAALSYQLCQ